MLTIDLESKRVDNANTWGTQHFPIFPLFFEFKVKTFKNLNYVKPKYVCGQINPVLFLQEIPKVIHNC
jgi:hypothetical protein